MNTTTSPTELSATTGPPCLWDQAWIGKCKLPSVKNGCCEKHQAACCSCGAPATHDCDETGQFVCGAPLCDNCEHTLHADGTNGGIGFNMRKPPEGMKTHCRKTEQRFTPWYARMLRRTKQVPAPSQRQSTLKMKTDSNAGEVAQPLKKDQRNTTRPCT